MNTDISKYETIVGLEVHVQLSTKSKAYCSDLNKFGEAPNTCISPISLGCTKTFVLGITVGRLISGPLCDPTTNSTVSHVPVTFTTCIVVNVSI